MNTETMNTDTKTLRREMINALLLETKNRDRLVCLTETMRRSVEYGKKPLCQPITDYDVEYFADTMFRLNCIQRVVVWGGVLSSGDLLIKLVPLVNPLILGTFLNQLAGSDVRSPAGYSPNMEGAALVEEFTDNNYEDALPIDGWIRNEKAEASLYAEASRLAGDTTHVEELRKYRAIVALDAASVAALSEETLRSVVVLMADLNCFQRISAWALLQKNLALLMRLHKDLAELLVATADDDRAVLEPTYVFKSLNGIVPNMEGWAVTHYILQHPYAKTQAALTLPA